jgi:hypothetical protein
MPFEEFNKVCIKRFREAEVIVPEKSHSEGTGGKGE